jgi:hypothetical protein
MYSPLSTDPTCPPFQERDGYPLGWRGRALLAAWSLCLLAGFGLAASLEPDSRRYGTHEQLGLPACTFRDTFGIPCPSCGMTTSFSHFVRGQWPSAARANAAGFLLAIVCAVKIPWCWTSAWSGRLRGISHPDATAVKLIVFVAFVALAHWAVRLLPL